LADIGDEHHRIVLLAVMGFLGVAAVERAETFGEGDLAVLIERLVAQQNHLMAMPDVDNRLGDLGRKRPAGVDANDFSPDSRRQRARRKEWGGVNTISGAHVRSRQDDLHNCSAVTDFISGGMTKPKGSAIASYSPD